MNPANPYGLESLWSQGDAVAHATLAILAVMSVATWTVMIVKWLEQYRLLRQARSAEAAFHRAGSLDEALTGLPPHSPFHILAAAGIEAVRHHDGVLQENVDRHTWLSLALGRATGRAVSRLQGGLPLLATVASTAPFVGLFGTVWGIHHALTAIGVSGQASIDKVAGPVGEALIMTAIGLAVAVPAVLGYNWLARRNKLAIDALRGFSADLHALLLGGRRMTTERPATLRGTVLASGAA
jgi:biopolymer transport protein ExbB